MADKLAYTLHEAAEVAGVSSETIRRAIHTIEGTPLRAKRSGKRFLVRAEDLQAWINNLPDA